MSDYKTISNLIEAATKQSVPIWRIVLDHEMVLTMSTEEMIYSKLSSRLAIMFAACKKALDKPCPTAGNLITGIAHTQQEYCQKDASLCGSYLNQMMAYALSASEVNASMGKICAAPTAGSCGILPAVLLSLTERYELSEEQLLHGLLTASGIGAVITKNATVAGAEGGCQAECGVAAAMAAGAAVELRGGTPAMIGHAVSLTLINCMGLVCDPVAGLVQVPCAQRNASQAMNAMLSADLALAGMQSLIPVDEVIDSMYKTGKQLPTELKETALGGIAATETGKKIAAKINVKQCQEE